MNTANVDRLWLRLERYLKSGKLVPVIGPGCITFGPEDTPLYPWLAGELVRRLDISWPAEMQPAPSLASVASMHLAAHGSVEDLCIELDTILEDVEIQPGPLLRDLAKIGAFNFYITLGFDPLLERALSQVRYGGIKPPKVWEFSLGQTPEDLPFAPKDAPQTLLAYLFGRISPNPSFHLWDHDAIEFVWSLQRALPSLNTLANTLATHNLLILGTDFSDWLVRFFLRVIKNKPLNEGRQLPFLLAESSQRREADAVLFYDALGGGIEFVGDSPLEFARTFVKRALEGFGLPDQQVAVIPPSLPIDKNISRGAIFISYAHVDAAWAFRVAETLQKAGCLIWLDRDRLLGGDNFNHQLEDAVRRHCQLFLSLITPTTESRVESYLHQERLWAAERSRLFAPGEPFYFPLASEDAPRPPQREPREFASIHVDLTVGGNIPDSLVQRLHELQQQRLTGG